MKFSLIIPCYNEEANLPLLIDRCKVLVGRPDIEVIFVDNGSTDNTSEVLRSLVEKYPGCQRIRIEDNQGYGFGIMSGLKVARGEILGWTHADMQTDPQDALMGLDFFDKHGNDIFVKGRRYGRPFMDVVFTIGMGIFETFLLARPMWDINAQPTLFSRRFFESWTTPPDDFALDLYAYYQAQSYGLKVCRFPVRFGERAFGVSHWNVNWAAKRRFIRRTIDFSFQLKKKTSK
jgi:glycosyltransferase involved in cell wall biosynthesis